MKWSNNNGELERVPGTENDPLTLGEKTLLAPELKLMSTELNLNQPPLPGMESLPVTKTKEDKLKEAELLVAKANKKTVGQLNKLKNWAQPKRKELSYGGYIDKEQRLYENLKVPGYETPEKSNVSYSRLKQKEKGTYPFDTPQGIDHVTKIMKEEATHKLSPKENKNIDILNKEMKLSVLKDEIGGLKKYDNLDRTSYPSDPEQRRRLKNIDKLEKSLGYTSPEVNVPYKKDTRTPNEKKKQNYNIEKRLKNARGPSHWELITKTATSWQDKQDIREIVNKNYKRDPSSIAPEDRKWLDKDLIKPVKIEYPEVILGSEPDTTLTPIRKDDRPIEQIINELANDRLVREQKDWEQRWGKDGITSLKRPE
tara:strand:+ start:128 stop:1234 length:1107 start_codon:yes stop_codon:yes gene_type:complete